MVQVLQFPTLNAEQDYEFPRFPSAGSKAETDWLNYILPPRDFARVCELAVQWKVKPIDAAVAMIGAYLDSEQDA